MRTGSGLTTFATRSIRPVCSVWLVRSSTQPSTSVPANRTRTRVPGTAETDSGSGTT